MKTAFHFCLLLALISPLPGQLSFTYETDAVLTSAGDFGNADGRRDIVVVDRASGQVTFGRPDVNGSFQWSPVEPSGIANVTGLAVDKFLGGSVDFAAITAPKSNRVSIASPSVGNSQLEFRHIFTSNPSPLALASFDPNADGLADLFIAGDRGAGFGSRYYYEFRTGLNGASTLQWTTAFTSETHRVFRFLRKTGTTPVLGEIYGTLFYTETPTTTGVTSPVLLDGIAVGPTTLMTYGNFDGGAFSQVILYSPGATIARAAKATEPSAGVFNWAAATTINFPKAVKQLVTIPTAAGGARLGILFSDSTAAVYDFDGVNLIFRSNLFGTPFSWLNPLGPDSVLGRNNFGWGRFNAASTNANNTPTQAGLFPALGSRQRVSNVVFFSAEPFTDATAAPLAQASVRDWSTVVTGGGTSWNVSAADVSASGIGSPSASSYTAAVSSTHGLANQFRSAISIRSLESAAGPNVPDVIIQPPGGTFRLLEEVTVSLNPTLANFGISYRINGGSWTNYSPSARPVITANTQFEAYAFSGSGKSPIRSANYLFAPKPALNPGSSPDLDGDGLPDAWEKSFNLADPNTDADGDGVGNLGEYLSGTDPRDPTDSPPLEFLLRYETFSNAGVRRLRLAWDLSLGNVILESNETLGGVWQTIADQILTENSERVRYFDLGPGNPPARFFRLRRP